MSNYDVDHITNIQEAFAALEACYLNPFLEYCKSDFDRNTYKASVRDFTLSMMIVRKASSFTFSHKKLYDYFMK